MAKFKEGQKVEWPWGAGFVKAKVVRSYTETIRRTIKGKRITRHGSPENPAYLLKTSKGVDVLKLETELYDGENSRD